MKPSIDLADDIVAALTLDVRFDAEEIGSFQCAVDALAVLLQERGGRWAVIGADTIARVFATIATGLDNDDADDTRFNELMLEAARQRGIASIVNTAGDTIYLSEVGDEDPHGPHPHDGRRCLNCRQCVDTPADACSQCPHQAHAGEVCNAPEPDLEYGGDVPRCGCTGTIATAPITGDHVVDC